MIIHYNDLESITNLINNVKKYKILDKVIIVDNNSNKDIKKELKKLISEKIELIENSENKGFAYAINIGSKKLIEEYGKCNIIISNSDIIINKEEDLEELILELDKKDIGLVAPTILENDKLNRGWKEVKPLLDSLLNIVFIHRFIRKKYVFYKDEHYKGKVSNIDIASGCFFLIKSDILKKINYLDENTFLYYEENILAKKLSNINKKIVILNDVIVIHNHSVSIDKNINKIKKLKIQKQSQYYYHVNYNHANYFEKILLKSTAFISRIILTVVYFFKDLRKN